jgi:hypothetical protein
MVANITGNQILIWDCRSQIFELCHVFKRLVAIFISRVFPTLWRRDGNKMEFTAVVPCMLLATEQQVSRKD